MEKLDSLKRDELVVLARKLKVTGYANLKKDDLKRLLIKNAPGKKLEAMLLKKWKKLFYISAAIASIVGVFLALYSIFFLPGETGPFAFTLRLRDAGGVAVLNGEGKLHMLQRTGEINKEGQVIFTNIPAKFKNQSVRVELLAPGWQFVKDNRDDKDKNIIQCLLTGSGKTLAIERDDSLSTLRFSVTDGNRRAVPGAAVLIENRKVGNTDRYGRLTVKLEKTVQKREVSVAIHKKGFKIWEGKGYPATNTIIKPVLEEAGK